MDNVPTALGRGSCGAATREPSSGFSTTCAQGFHKYRELEERKPSAPRLILLRSLGKCDSGAREVEKSVEVLQRGRSSVNEERERFFSRLATIPGVRTMPSIGSWILVRVDNPADVARKVNRRLAAGTVSVPRSVAGAVRVPVRDPKRNEELFQTIRDLLAAGCSGCSSRS